MLQNLLEWDRDIYLIINSLPHPWWLNSFFLFFDYLTCAGVAWVLFCLGMIIFGKRKNLRIMGLMGLNLIEASGARRYENSPAFRPRDESFLTKCVAF